MGLVGQPRGQGRGVSGEVKVGCRQAMEKVSVRGILEGQIGGRTVEDKVRTGVEG